MPRDRAADAPLQAFTLWASHFSRLAATCAPFAPARMLTLVRAQHMSFSDVLALAPARLQPSDGRALLRTVCLLADKFLRREVKMAGPELGVDGVRTRGMEVEWVAAGEGREKKKRIVGEEGDIVLH
jgi:platelet-activating factor acetylhydrolase